MKTNSLARPLLCRSVCAHIDIDYEDQFSGTAAALPLTRSCSGVCSACTLDARAAISRLVLSPVALRWASQTLAAPCTFKASCRLFISFFCRDS